MSGKKSGRPGTYVRKKSHHGKAGMLAAAVVLVLSGFSAACLLSREPEKPPVTMLESIPDAEKEIQSNPYENILKKYCAAVEDGWDPGICVENDLSFLVGFHAGQPETLGYSCQDLDGNGIPELIVSDGSVIYDMYTMFAGQEPIWLLSGSERMVYSLCEDGSIFYRGSGGAALTGYVVYRLRDGALEVETAYLFDALQDLENPWFHSIDGTQRGEPASAGEVEEWLSSCIPVEIDITRFSEDT